MRFWDCPPDRTPEDTRFMHDALRAPGERRYFAWDLGGKIVGAGGIHGRDELGFILHPDHWGKGLAREAAEAVIAHHWATSEATRILAEVDPRNLASVGLLTRLRFRATGYLRDAVCVDGVWSDSLRLALPRPNP